MIGCNFTLAIAHINSINIMESNPVVILDGLDSSRTTIEAMQRFLASLTVQVLRFPDISPRTRNRRHQGCRTRHKRCDVRQFLCRPPSSPKFQRQLAAIATKLKFVSVSFEPLYRDEIKFRPMLSIRTGRANCVPGSSRSRAK